MLESLLSALNPGTLPLDHAPASGSRVSHGAKFERAAFSLAQLDNVSQLCVRTIAGDEKAFYDLHGVMTTFALDHFEAHSKISREIMPVVVAVALHDALVSGNCSKCNGTGQALHKEKLTDCPQCHGAGKILSPSWHVRNAIKEATGRKISNERIRPWLFYHYELYRLLRGISSTSCRDLILKAKGE
ncbi:hypothetical protein KUW19_00660 [Ferrimonas balearica]|uniref:hypothetical protein n=1 Tax=Ferrimonas balearica TaxID=44012 RepID=UPI001C97FA37|nr:hypothetical protein [Ferrimonas balearica]MBY6104987.1 hypothetical protein [Ferrimonas balearica]